MGCICSKYSLNKDKIEKYGKESDWNKSSVQLVAPTHLNGVGVGLDGSNSVPRLAKASSQVVRAEEEKSSHFDVAIKIQHHRCKTVSSGIVAKEAIKGWVPRRADSFEKLDQIGQGAYSSVHKALDLESGKYVALKKVRFSSGDVESVRFMAREIYILRQLDHPNILKLEGIVTSRTSTSLYLVFEYMEHDLAGLAARPAVKFTEPQIKCFMKQLLSGLEHCHSRGVLHRDIKGSNLLVDSNGNLKIGDFGLATVHEPDSKVPLTSRVVTLWYRAPELLLGATDYGATIDLWSAGCILAELLVGKPIMPGRTENNEDLQLLPFGVSICYKYPNYLVNVRVDICQFFTTDPLPCDPSRLPKFPPSKEFDLKRQNKEAARKNLEAIKGCGPRTVVRGAGNTKALEAPEYNARGDLSLRGKPNTRMSRLRYESQEDEESNHKCEPSRISMHNGYTNSTTLMHSNTTGASSLCNKRPESSLQDIPELRTQRSHLNEAAVEFSIKKEEGMPGQEIRMGYVPKKNRIHCSGPLMMSSGGNIDDMLREHERLMQDVFRSVKKGNP
ncbi:hypothetical protein TSUD_229770 [Trifolium subterraneum]|uniref:Protein kinase domain-containing protein n=1 Tax=Trifolium subterraneum TaxID=3900 RepID=A0A2Z6M1P1_TRISU|nr:hypothetical protein TSUD_229770 [Trifolium subterraneum]